MDSVFSLLYFLITHVTHPVIPAKAGISEKRGFLLSQE